MTPRRLMPLYLGVAVISVALVVLAAVALERREKSRADGGNPLGNPPGMVDRLVRIETADAFGRGSMEGTRLVPGTPARVELSPGEPKDFPKAGTWTSPEMAADFPFTELIPSWNLTAPEGTGVWFEVRVRGAASGEWSPWMYIGYWGRVRVPGKRVTSFAHGKVNEDNLVLDRAADAWQVRANFQTFDPGGAGSAELRRVSAVYSGVVDAATRRKELMAVDIKGDWARDLAVPYRPQGDAPGALAEQVCSPTSTSMVMAYCGVEKPTVENAMAIYDQDYGIFGNWGRAVARAGEMGLDAWVTRFRTLDQVKASIAAGQPIICSIRAKKGDFQGPAIYQETPGHLIVIRGLTPDGNVIVNDPAKRSKGNGFIYNWDDVQRIWIDHGGVAYIIRKADAPTTRAVVAGG